MFKLNPAYAKANDNRSAFISEAGKYKGVFSRVEYIQKPGTGSTGLGVTFISEDKQEANFYINLSYKDKNGQAQENKTGMNLLNAIMTCFSLRESGDTVITEVSKYNKDTKKMEKVGAPCFVNLMNKPIGILVQMRFDKGSTSEHPSPYLYTAFQADTELLAGEILDKKTVPEKLAKVVEYIASNPLIDSRFKGAVPPPPARKDIGQTQSIHSSDDLDDDIPF